MERGRRKRNGTSGTVARWQRFVQVFRLTALQAGAVAQRLRGRVGLEEKSGEASPQAAALTQVDLAAQDVILLALAEAFPRVAVDAEEETETAALFPPEAPSRPCIVVDPVDGTLNYAEGSGDYAVMGAWVEGGRYRAAVVRFPERRETFWAVEGEGAWVEREGEHEARPAEVRTAPPHAALSGAVPEDWKMVLAREGLEGTHTHCSAVDALAPLLGRAQVTVWAERPSRRGAIGLLITREAGGAVHAGGRPWNGEDAASGEAARGPTVVAGTEELAGRISDRLGAR